MEDRPPIRTVDRDLPWPTQFVRVATVGVLAASILLPAVRLYDIALLTAPLGGVSGGVLYAAVAVACYMPVQVWLLLSAVRRPFGPRQRLGLAAIAAVMFAMLPVVGVGWVGILYMLGALVLVGLRPPASLLLYGMLVVAPSPLSFAFGHPEWALYFTFGMLIYPMSMAVVIRLIRAVRELQEAQETLVEQAVLRERQHIDEEVNRSLGIRLAAIADEGGRAEETAGRDKATAALELGELVGDARRTLAEARRVVVRYREVSLSAELITMRALLSAGGIDARVVLPGQLPDRIDEADRESLRRETARVLQTSAPGSAVTIVVTAEGDQLRLNLEDGRAGAAEVAAE